MADKTAAAFFCERVVWWCVLLLASSGMVSAYPVSGKVDTVSLKDEVLEEICSARHSSLWNLYNSFHKEYASASQNGAPTAGPISCEDALVTCVTSLVTCVTALVTCITSLVVFIASLQTCVTSLVRCVTSLVTLATSSCLNSTVY